MDTLIRDIRFALTALMTRPGLTLPCILTLALGVGANTAIFSVANALLLRPFSFPDLDRLVTVWETRPEQRFGRFFVTPGDFIDWRNENQVFEHVAAYHLWTANLAGGGEPEQVRAARVSHGFIPALGVRPVAGRSFAPDEEQPGHDASVVLSHGLWQRRFAADPAAVGTTIVLDGRRFTVIGILPPDSEYPPRVELWTPLALTPAERLEREEPWLGVIARLRPRASVSQAAADLNTIAARLARAYPATNAGRTLGVYLLRDYSADLTGPFLLVLQVAAVFVLLIACANVMNLLLTRTVDRRREMALRGALGASRARMVRQMLTENLVLALAGAALAVAFAYWGLQLIRNGAAPDRAIAGWEGIELDGHALVFTLCVGVATCVLFGLAPALQASTPRLNEDLKEGGRTAASGFRRRPLRSVLVAGEVALALALLVGATLIVKGFDDILGTYGGFNPQRVLTLRIALSPSTYERSADAANFYQTILERIAGLPGVTAASAISWLPASFRFTVQSFEIQRRPPSRRGPAPSRMSRSRVRTIFGRCRFGSCADVSSPAPTVCAPSRSPSSAKAWRGSTGPIRTPSGRRFAWDRHEPASHG